MVRGSEGDHERVVGEQAGWWEMDFECLVSSTLDRAGAERGVRTHTATQANHATAVLVGCFEELGDENIGDSRLERCADVGKVDRSWRAVFFQKNTRRS